MNSYNDNLRSAVVNSLQGQYLNQKNLKSQMTAAMFTLYHAEGAAVDADEKLEQAKSTLSFKAAVKTQAVKNSNIAVNLLASANQADQYFKQSINNTAVCAANVQVSAKSIVRLSGDIANIAGITDAADLETDIDELSKGIRTLMEDTAKIAELASRYAMEASSLTAEVSSGTVLAKAKSTNALMNNMLQVASANYDTASQIVAADNVTLALTSGAEKMAEGALEDVSVDYQASRDAYQSVNQKLNINLRVPHARLTNTDFTVYFDAIESAFPFRKDSLQDKNATSSYPVEEYFAIVVKENKMLTYTISEAENMQVNIGRYKDRITRIPQAHHRHLKHVFPYGTLEDPLQDSDGDVIIPGQSYVVFVLAVYIDAYKYALNTYDNFLSAPSKPFTLTIKLNAAVFSVKPVYTTQDQTDDMRNFQEAQPGFDPNELSADISAPDYWQMLEFHAYNSDQNQPEYRCMFLPAEKALVGGLLTNAALKNLVLDELPSLEDLFADFDKEFASLEKKWEGDESKTKKAREQVKKDVQTILKDILPIPLLTQMEHLFIDWLTELKDEAELKSISDKLKALIAEQTNIMHLLGKTEDRQGLFFDPTLAEQVGAGNYSVAVKPIVPEDEPTEQLVRVPNYLVFIGPETTDNFGTPLIKGKEYMPFVLSVSKKAIDDPQDYTSALTAIGDKYTFIYNQQPTNN